MSRLHFSTDIQAPRATVWNVLWNDATYREWTRVFSEGSHAVSDWNEGSKVQFLDATSGSGMSAVIEQKRPNEFMSFKHVAEIKNGEEQPPAEWSGAFENYRLEDSGRGATKLTVELDTPDEHREMFEARFPKALEKVKVLSETRGG